MNIRKFNFSTIMNGVIMAEWALYGSITRILPGKSRKVDDGMPGALQIMILD